MLKIGDLAKKTGLTVRALYHYEEIGLLIPQGRTHAGHRLYSYDNLARLQQILSLKQCGLDLTQIKACLDEQKISLSQTLNHHIDYLEQSIAQKQQLLGRLHLIQNQITEETVEISDFIQTIEEMVMFEKYYTKNQLDDMHARKDVVGDKRMNEIEKEWQSLFDLISQNKAKGFEITHPETQRLAKKAFTLFREMFGDRDDVLQATFDMYRAEGGEKLLKQNGFEVSESTFDYLQQAMDPFWERIEN